MTTIVIEKVNEVYLRVMCSDLGVESELSDYFTYEYPGARFTPRYKAKLWDGKIKLYDAVRRTLYVGLYSYVVRFAETRGYIIQTEGSIFDPSDVTVDQVTQFTSALNLHGRGNKIDIRDYQIEAVHSALTNHRQVLLSPTGSGKSLIIYAICRWWLLSKKKILVVVPTTSLVEQLYSDFEDYSSHNNFSVSDHCQKLYSGFPKVFASDIMFTTWQSIYSLPKPWFEQFDAIIGDECHLFKAKSLISIMEKLVDTKHKIGTTGSLDDKKIHKLVLEGIFGPIHRVTTTKTLQSQGQLAQLKIKALLLKYPNDIRQQMAKAEYQQEIDFLVAYDKRNKFIRNLALDCKGNTLVLFQYVERHGSIIFDMIKDKVDPSRQVFFIHGGTDVQDREQVRTIMGTQDNAIIVASFGVFSTGINIPSIENIIFASPSKSKIRNLQSIGRGLRLNDGKTHCNLFDITDDLHWKSWKNHTLKHGAERYKLYSEEGFALKLFEVDL